MEAKVTISRNSLDEFTLKIDDQRSGLRVAEVVMEPADFALCLTGLAATPAKFKFWPKEFTAQNIGKQRETKRVKIDWKRSSSADQNDLHDLIQPHLIDGWMLHNDGLTSQQPANGHVVILYRFMEAQ